MSVYTLGSVSGIFPALRSWAGSLLWVTQSWSVLTQTGQCQCSDLLWTLGWPSALSPTLQSCPGTGACHDCPNSSVWRLLLAGGVKQKVSQVPSAQHHCWRGQGIHCCTLTNTNPAWNNCTAPAPCSSLGPRCHGCQWELEPKCSWGFGLFCPGIILLALSHLVASSSTEQFKCCLPPKRKSQLSDDWSILLWINLKIRRFEGFIGLWMSFMLQTCG